MANKELTVRVKGDVSHFEKSLKKLEHHISAINKTLGTIASNIDIEAPIDRATQKAKKLNQTLTEYDKLAQKLQANSEKNKRNEYVNWWKDTLKAQEQEAARAAKAAKEQAKINAQLQKQAQKEAQLKAQTEKVNAAWRKAHPLLSRIGTKLGMNVTQTQEWWSMQQRLMGSFKKTESAIGKVWNKLKGLFATYLGIMGVREIVDASDTITAAQNKLNYVNARQMGGRGVNADGTYSASTFKATQESMDKMYASSQKVRMSYADMMSNVSKSMVLAGDSFQHNTDAAIRFQEIMAEAYAIGGASATEMSTSMYQLIQALGAGTLAGDELRSVREGAPLAYKAIEEFVQGVYNSEESLKDLASQGKVTSDMVVAAIMKQGNAIDKSFAQTAQTFGQTWDQIKNAALKAFEPVSNMLRDLLNKAIKNGMIDKIESMFETISEVLQKILTFTYDAIAWMAENWDWLKHVIVGVFIAMGTWSLISSSVSIAAAVATKIAWWKGLNDIQKKAVITFGTIIAKAYAIIALLAALAYVWYTWKQGVIDTVTAIAWTALIVGAIVAVILGGWIPLLIGGIIALIIKFFDIFCGIMGFIASIVVTCCLLIWDIVVFVVHLIVAIIVWMGATLYNIFVACFNSIMQAIYALFVDPITGIIEWFVNAFSGGFNGILGAAANAIGQLVNMFLSGLKVITKAIDAVAGTEMSAKITGWQESAKNWGKNENAVTYKVAEAPQLSRVSAGNAFGAVMGNDFGYATDLYPDTWKWTSGAYNWGQGVQDKVNNWGSKFQNAGKDNTSGQLDKTGIGALDKLLGTNEFPNASDPAYDVSNAYKQPSYDDLLKGVDDIADNTGSMADSMELTEEDLDYLRKIADMEWKKEFTSATVNIKMDNNIKSDADYEGFVTRLHDDVYDELLAVANGVYE